MSYFLGYLISIFPIEIHSTQTYLHLKLLVSKHQVKLTRGICLSNPNVSSITHHSRVWQQPGDLPSTDHPRLLDIRAMQAALSPGQHLGHTGSQHIRHGPAASYVWPVPKVVPEPALPEPAPDDPLWHLAVPVQCLPLRVHAEGRPEGAHENPHWGAAISLPPLPHAFCQEMDPQCAHPYPHGRTSLQVHTLSQGLLAE